MKLLHSATAIALISASLVASNPAIARWQYVTRNKAGQELYIKDPVCRRGICEADFDWSEPNEYDFAIQINCRDWTYRVRNVIGPYIGLYKEDDLSEKRFRVMGPKDVYSAIGEALCN